MHLCACVRQESGSCSSSIQVSTPSGHDADAVRLPRSCSTTEKVPFSTPLRTTTNFRPPKKLLPRITFPGGAFYTLNRAEVNKVPRLVFLGHPFLLVLLIGKLHQSKIGTYHYLDHFGKNDSDVYKSYAIAKTIVD